MFWVDSDGDSVFHGTVDSKNHIGKVRDVQRNHSDVRPPRKDQEAAHPCTQTAHAKTSQHPLVRIQRKTLLLKACQNLATNQRTSVVISLL